MSVLMCYRSDLADIQPQLFTFVENRVANANDVGDVVQNSNRVLINKEGEYNAKYPFKSWVFGIAKWQVLAYYKRCKRSVPLFSLDVSEEINPDWLADVPFSNLIKKERLELIKNLSCMLSKRQKQVFNLLIEGFTHQEIADSIGTSKLNVQVLKARLMERIKKFVSNNNEKYHNY